MMDYSGWHIAVVGDFMIDKWYSVEKVKISPEAPVHDLVNPKLVRSSPGGAGNVAGNLLRLGAQCTVHGLAGHDEDGVTLREKLTNGGAYDCLRCFDNSEILTHAKIRYMNDGQQLFRISRERRDYDQLSEIILADLVRRHNLYDAIIVADYNKGVMTPAVIQQVMSLGIPVMVDPKHDNFWSYKGATIFKPNELEAQTAICEKLHTSPSNTLISTRWGACISQELDAKYVVITRGKYGMYVTDTSNTGEAELLPAHEVEIADIAGAGDTAIAVMTLEYLDTGDIMKAAQVANLACSLVVQHSGVVPICLKELNGVINQLVGA